MSSDTRTDVTELADRAQHSPTDVSPTAFEPFLRTDDDEVLIEAIRGVRAIADDDPGRIEPLVSEIVPLRRADRADVREATGELLIDIATRTPSVLAGWLDEFAAGLEEMDTVETERTLRILHPLSQSEPEAVVGTVPQLLEIIAAAPPATQDEPPAGPGNKHYRQWQRKQRRLTEIRHTNCRTLAARTLASLVDGAPGRVEIDPARWLSFLDDGNEVVAKCIAEAIASYSEAKPGAMADSLPDLVAALEDERYDAVRGELYWVVAAVAEARPDLVADELDGIEVLASGLTAEAPRVRGACIDLVATLAETESEQVRPLHSELVERLTDEHKFIRARASRALGALGTDTDEETLRSAVRSESNEGVRNEIQRALDRINEK